MKKKREKSKMKKKKRLSFIQLFFFLDNILFL